MPTAIATSRGWSARSPASAGSFAPTPTDILEPTVRLEEPSECPTPTQQLASRPSRSQYVRNGTSNSSRTSFPPGVIRSTDKARGLAKSLEFPMQPERRSSSLKAHHAGEGDMLDSEIGWTSTPVSVDHSQHSSRKDPSSIRVSGSGGVGRSARGRGSNSSSSSCSNGSGSARSRTAVTISGTGSSLRSGGRSNFFFGSDYSASSGRPGRADIVAASSKVSIVSAERSSEAAAGKYVAGSTQGVVPSKAKKAHRGSKLKDEAGRTKALAVQDGQRKPDLSADAGRNSPRQDEAPPPFAPLGTDERRKRFSQSNGVGMAPEGEVRVAFPSDFDGSRKESNGVSKVQSGDSLGSKSGSTSLLSMLSGSPRSLGTVHDTGSGSSSPRSPLPKVSMESGEGAAVDKGNVLPSAYPTPLSMFGGDTDLPSDHPTPLSTMGSSKGSVRKIKPRPASAGSAAEREKAMAAAAAAKATSTTVVAKTKRDNDAVTAGAKVVNPAASTFMQRLKYWGGSIVEESDARAPAVVASGSASAAAVTVATADRRVHAEAHANSGAVADVAVEPSSRKSGGTLGANQTTMVVEVGTSTVFAACHVNAFVKETPLELERTPSFSTAESYLTSSEIGVKVVPLDTVTSDAVSVFASGESQRQWREKAPPPPHQPLPPPPPSDQSYGRFASSRPAKLGALGLARETPAPSGGGDEGALGEVREREVDEDQNTEEDEEEVESDMDWEAVSNEEEEKEKMVREVLPPPPTLPPVVPEKGHTEPAPPYSARRMVEPAPETATPKPQSPPPPRYMAIVESANVTSALDNNSSTSEHDTSPSEDDGNMMEILTDRLMEACHKIEEVTAIPADELSDGGTSVRRRGGPGSVASSIRRRQLSSMSSRAFSRDQIPGSTHRHGHQQSSFFSTTSLAAAVETEEKFDSDDEGVDGDEGAAARKLRRERVRKRTRAQSRRKLAGALTVPTDAKGEPIDVHTAAYSGEVDLVTAYVSQGGDLELRDQFKATPLMLASERGHTEIVDALLTAGADLCSVDENGNSALHLACFYGNRDVVELLLAVDVELSARDSEGRTPLDLATDPNVWRMVRTEEVVRQSGETFDLLAAVEVNDTNALGSFIHMGQEACGYPENPGAIPLAAQRLRLDRKGRSGMTAVHLAAFHGYVDALSMLLEGGADPNAVCDDGETPLHTACTGGSTQCAIMLLDHGANPLATDAKGLVPCEKHIAGGRQDMKRLLEVKAFQATPINLMALRADLAEVSLQIDAEEELFVRKGVAIKYLRKALKKKEADVTRLRQAVDSRDRELMNLSDRMDSVYRILSSGTSRAE